MFRQITTDFFLPRLNRGYKSYEHLIEGTIDNRQLTQLQFLAEKGFDIAKELDRWKSQAQSIDCQEIVDYLSSYPLNIPNIKYNSSDSETKSDLKNSQSLHFEIVPNYDFETKSNLLDIECETAPINILKQNESTSNLKFSIKEEELILEVASNLKSDPINSETIPNPLDSNSINPLSQEKTECKIHPEEFISNTSDDVQKIKITNKDKLNKQLKEKLAVRSTKNKNITKVEISIPTKKISKIRKFSKISKPKTSLENEFILVNFNSNVNGVSCSCKAKTKQGNSCRRSVISGSQYCFQHKRKLH